MTGSEYRASREFLDEHCRRRLAETLEFCTSDEERAEALRRIDAEHGAAIDALHANQE
jgi:hypothetical protein